MNKRLQQFLTAENITQSQFAERIGVAKASVSHILAGRNKPGFEFIESMANCYPNLNLEWLIGGKGRMYKGTEPPTQHQPDIKTAESPKSSSIPESNGRIFDSHEPELFSGSTEQIEGKAETSPVSPSEPKSVPPRIKKILIFYDNGTFKEIE